MVAPHNISRLYVGVLFVWLIGYLLSLAIQYTDSDLWYHLAGGRHLLETGSTYNPLLKSFLSEPRDFVNYFWGFQAAAYLTWLIAGETGLITLKAIFFFICAFFALRILLEGKRTRDAEFLQLFLFAILIGILCARGLSLRPHLASYAMIPIFIYILAYREKIYWLLPLLTIIWVNLHGIEYIVGALICGSYFLSRMVNFRGELKPLIWISLCLPATLFNPNGFELWLTPFILDPDLNKIVAEMGYPEFQARLGLPEGINVQMLALIFLGFVFLSALRAIKHLRANLGPILVAVGGLFLLLKAGRFIWEWALLSLPLVAVGLQYLRVSAPKFASVSALVGIFALIVITCIPSLKNGLQKYPIDIDSLPYGTTAFIQNQELKGSYAVAPSYAGYIEFTLEDVKIHQDMQFPPFTPMDFQEIFIASISHAGLKTYIKKHSPDMLGIDKRNKNFPIKTAYGLGYLPVFFDKKIVLFINKEKFENTATDFELKVINPFNETKVRTSKVDEAINELESMLIAVNSDYVKRTLVGYLIERVRLREAEIYLSELEKSSPKDLTTLYYKARFEHLSDNCEAAIPNYLKTIGFGNQNLLLHRQIAECYFLTGDLLNAYKHFTLGLNSYLGESPKPLLYFQYALSAAAAGETEYAQKLLTMIERFEPDSEIQPQISALLIDLKGE